MSVGSVDAVIKKCCPTSNGVTGAQHNKAYDIQNHFPWTLSLTQNTGLAAKRFCYCLSSNNVLASSDRDYSHSLIYNPDGNGLKPSSAKSTPSQASWFSTPTCLSSFYSNPVSYHPLSEVRFLTLVVQQAECFLIHQGGSSG